jgi:hypothetical protein
MTDKELFELCQRYGREARKWKNKFISLLPEVYKRRLYRKRKFCSIYEFAAKLGGISKNVVDDAIRLDEKFEKMPELKALMSDVGVSKLKTVAGIAKKETDRFWANKAKTMTRSGLATYIHDIKKIPGENDSENHNLSLFDQQNDFSENQNLKTQNTRKSTFSMQLSEKSIFNMQLLKQKLEKEQGEILCWNEVVQMVSGKLLVEKSKPQKNPRPSNPKLRQASTKQRRDALEKTNGKCSINGCNKPATEIHHEKPWAIHKSHDDLQPLCKDHHELAHQSDSTIDQKVRTYKLQVATF